MWQILDIYEGLYKSKLYSRRTLRAYYIRGMLATIQFRIFCSQSVI
jgi:hypothetical protein